MTSFLFIAAAIAIASPPAQAHAPARAERAVHETVKPIAREALPNAPGKDLVAVEVVFPPGAAASPHTHPAFVYAYVVSGQVLSAVGQAKPRLYRAGESWTEPPGAYHRVTRNPSRSVPAKLLAIFVADAGTNQLVRPAGR
jgi:quercetin dioxygenase-like cupin family protein